MGWGSWAASGAVHARDDLAQELFEVRVAIEQGEVGIGGNIEHHIVVVGDRAFQGGDGLFFTAEQRAGAGQFEAGRLAGVEEMLLRDAHGFEHSVFPALGQSALGGVGDGQ